jgi:hypothetical protein
MWTFSSGEVSGEVTEVGVQLELDFHLRSTTLLRQVS